MRNEEEYNTTTYACIYKCIRMYKINICDYVYIQLYVHVCTYLHTYIYVWDRINYFTAKIELLIIKNKCIAWLVQLHN